MINRFGTTVVLATLLLLVGLLAPVAVAEPAGAEVETVTHLLEGLPAQPAGDGTGASRLFGATAPPAEGNASQPLRTPIAFSMLGFEVPQGPADLWFRTSGDGNDWSDWAQAAWHFEDGPDDGSPEAARDTGRTISAPVWVGEAEWVQVRTADGLDPQDVSVFLIDSMGLHRNVAQRTLDAFRAAWAGSGRVAGATVSQPTIRTRAQWGADESKRRGNPSYAGGGLKAGYVHHTAGTGTSVNTYSEAQVPALIRGFYAYHTDFQGWSDIGYNFLVDRFGRIWEGRHGGIDRAVIGAHAAGFNTGTTGVAVIGNFEHVNPSSAAVEAVAGLLAWKFDVHHVDAEASVRLTSRGGTSNRYPEGAQVTLRSVNGHRDTGITACPGLLYNHLSTIRSRVTALATDMFVQPSATPGVVHVQQGGGAAAVTFSTGLKPAGAWSFELRGPQGALVRSASGSGATATVTWQTSNPVPGTYTYRFTASGRRPATGTVVVRELLLERIGASSDPIAGAIHISRVAFPGAASADHAVIARADLFADAMSGGPLAGTQGPLLLTGSSRLDARVRTELQRVLAPGATVYVLGGTQALEPAVVADLEATWAVQRIGGQERTETAARVAQHVRARSGTDTVMLARSAPDSVQPWADALAGGAYGAKAGVPVLLTPSGQLTPATRSALEGVRRTIVLGGAVAISESVFAQVPGAVRVRGQDRSGTAAAVAAQLWGRTSGRDGDLMILGPGYREGAWQMTLAAAPLAARRDAPLLLANAGTLPPETRAYVSGLSYGGGRRASGWVVGPASAVGEKVVDELSRLLR